MVPIGTPWSDEERERLAAMLERGHSRRECAEALGRPFGAVKSLMTRTGLRSHVTGGDSATWARQRPSTEGKRDDGFVREPVAPSMRPNGPHGPMHDSCERDGKYSCPSVPVVESVLSQAQPAVPGQDTFRAQEADPAHDPALHVPTAPRGYHLRGVSTLLDGAGVPVQTWVKTTRDPAADRLDELWSALQRMPDCFRGIHEPVKCAGERDADLLCVYTLADLHLGMFSWAAETGSDWDLKIAERVVTKAAAKLVESAPPSDEAIIVELGDFFHCDNDSARTARNGNQLDTDTRWGKVADVGIGVLRTITAQALKKHRLVRIITAIGNHDELGAKMLARVMRAYYENDERVSVDPGEGFYRWHRFGANLFGITHGDGPKPEKLSQLMAAMRPADWGETKYRRWLTGHKHHQSVHEFPGCVVQCFGTPAPSDAWATREGYMSGRDMRVDVYHRERGPRGGLIETIEPEAA